MINTKLVKSTSQTSEEKLFKVLESIDWKLWEMYSMMKKELETKPVSTKKSTSKKIEVEEE